MSEIKSRRGHDEPASPEIEEDFVGQSFYLDRRISKEIFQKIKDLGEKYKAERRKVNRLKKNDQNNEAKIEFYGRYLKELDQILVEAYNLPELGSNTKLKALIMHYGLCLTNGVCYGKKLKYVLKKNRHLIIPRDYAKENFEKVKVVLIHVFR